MHHQKLHIPKEWEVRHNEFYAIEPNYSNLDDPTWFHFHSEMLQLKNQKKELLLDLGWSPEFHPEGSYKLIVVKIYPDAKKMKESWKNPLATFTSKSRRDLVKVIETFLTLHWI